MLGLSESKTYKPGLRGGQLRCFINVHFATKEDAELVAQFYNDKMISWRTAPGTLVNAADETRGSFLELWSQPNTRSTVRSDHGTAKGTNLGTVCFTARKPQSKTNLLDTLSCTIAGV